MLSAGIIFSLIALVSWGFGDFFIQKTARALGSWKALFYIGITAFLVFLPFVWNQLSSLSWFDVVVLSVLSIIIVFAALFDFEALREGKIAVVEPVLGLELPITIGLSIALLNERLNINQGLAIALVFVGIVLAITKNTRHFKLHQSLFEKGAALAGIGAVGMAVTNFMFGFASQNISPLMAIWFGHSVLAIISFLVLSARKQLTLRKDLKNHFGIIAGESILDNSAWLGYAYATTLVPVSIVTTISESYIVLAVLLGLYLNRERLKQHQVVGVALAIVGVIVLSLITN